MNTLLDGTDIHSLHPLPSVSIITAVHNGERYIAEAIESVLCQTHQDFEFIIVDDGSTDSTLGILAEYATHDERIKVIAHANVGQPGSLNRALAAARNDWVAVFDSDDVCMPHRLETQLRVLQREPSTCVLGASAVIIDHRGQIRGIRHPPPSSVSEFKNLVRENRVILMVHPTVIMHRPTILSLGGYDPNFGPAADIDLWSRVSDNHVIINLPEPLVYYRIHSDSMSARCFRKQRLMFRWIEARQQARRQGFPQPTLEQFGESQKNWFSFYRLNNSRQDLGLYFGMRSRIDWWRGCQLRAVLERMASIILRPRAAVRRMMSSYLV